MSVDAEGQMIASIMAKKGSVSATHLVIDIPIGPCAKIKTKKDASKLGEKFKFIGKNLGIKTEILISDGSEPVGNGIGPLLEARDVLWVLERDPARSIDLEKRSMELAAKILELAGVAKKGKGQALACEILETGKAHKKMLDIIYAQGGVKIRADQLSPGIHTYDYTARKSGKISFNNPMLSRIARLAGAPKDIDAGIFLYKHKGDKVEKWDKIFTVYAASKEKLNYCMEHLSVFDGIVIK